MRALHYSVRRTLLPRATACVARSIALRGAPAFVDSRVLEVIE
jgi:hypothetical protein